MSEGRNIVKMKEARIRLKWINVFTDDYSNFENLETTSILGDEKMRRVGKRRKAQLPKD